MVSPMLNTKQIKHGILGLNMSLSIAAIMFQLVYSFYQNCLSTIQVHIPMSLPHNNNSLFLFTANTDVLHNSSYNYSQLKSNKTLGIQNSYKINLQHREDRRLQIENTLRTASIPYERLKAVNTHK
jgi:hypothetical protein